MTCGEYLTNTFEYDWILQFVLFVSKSVVSDTNLTVLVPVYGEDTPVKKIPNANVGFPGYINVE